MTASRIDCAPHAARRDLERLRATLRGAALAPDDEGYDRACQAWNLNAVQRPALVVLAEDASDMRSAVRFARQQNLGVGVLATGHGTGVPCDGGVLINTSRMRRVHVDPDTRTARVDAGALWEDVIDAASVFGLTGLPGSSAKVGVVGYTLGGGFGWLGRRYGLAAHSVTRAEVVTADGELVTADPNYHHELFWGLKGGTGNLGIVASLEFAVHPVRDVYAGNLYYPLDRARDVLEFFAGWTRSAPPELTGAATFRTFPPLPGVPEPLRGRSLVAVRGCYCGAVEDGRALIDKARDALGPAAVDTFAVMPAAGLAAISMDPVEPLGAVNHSELLPELTPEIIDALVDVAGPQSGSPLVMLEIRQLGGALRGRPDELSPMAHTRATVSLNAIGITPNPERAAAVLAHLATIRHRIGALATGDTYINFLDLDGATPERIRTAYSAADWLRLVRLKETYDPADVFRFNRNIPVPAPVGPAHSESRPTLRKATQQ